MPIETKIQTTTDGNTRRARVLAARARSVAQPDQSERCLVIFTEPPDNSGLVATVIRGVEAYAVANWSGPVPLVDGFHYRQWFVGRQTPEIAEAIREQLSSPPRLSGGERLSG